MILFFKSTNNEGNLNVMISEEQCTVNQDVGDVFRAARGGAAAGVGGRGGGLPAAADHSHSRGLPQTEENIPGQWSCNIGAQRHKCMEGLEN